MTKHELAERIAAEPGLPAAKVQEVVEKAFGYIADALLADKRVEFRGFGVFETRLHKARVGRNPRRPRLAITIPARRCVKFKPGKTFRDKLRGL